MVPEGPALECLWVDVEDLLPLRFEDVEHVDEAMSCRVQASVDADPGWYGIGGKDALQAYFGAGLSQPREVGQVILEPLQ